MTIDEKVLEAFYNIVSENKQEMYDRIAADRTRYVKVVMENIQKDHNASAVLRTCDCFGIQDLHTIEKNQEYSIQREIAKGAGTWVDTYSHTEGEHPEIQCLTDLKKDGYKIVSTSPHAEMTLFDVPIDQPLALVFGTEVKGISEHVVDHSDYTVRIPMYGFTESFNVSVSAALALNTLRRRLENSEIDWQLSHEDQVRLKIQWCTKIVRDGIDVEREIRRRILEESNQNE